MNINQYLILYSSNFIHELLCLTKRYFWFNPVFFLYLLTSQTSWCLYSSLSRIPGMTANSSIFALESRLGLLHVLQYGPVLPSYWTYHIIGNGWGSGGQLHNPVSFWHPWWQLASSYVNNNSSTLGHSEIEKPF